MAKWTHAYVGNDKNLNGMAEMRESPHLHSDYALFRFRSATDPKRLRWQSYLRSDFQQLPPPKVYYLYGPSGSGKTTWAEENHLLHLDAYLCTDPLDSALMFLEQNIDQGVAIVDIEINPELLGYLSLGREVTVLGFQKRLNQ